MSERTVRVGFPHAMIDGKPQPIMVTDMVSMGDLRFQLTWCCALTPEDLEDFEAWLESVKRRTRRWSAAYQESEATVEGEVRNQ